MATVRRVPSGGLAQPDQETASHCWLCRGQSGGRSPSLSGAGQDPPATFSRERSASKKPRAGTRGLASTHRAAVISPAGHALDLVRVRSKGRNVLVDGSDPPPEPSNVLKECIATPTRCDTEAIPEPASQGAVGDADPFRCTADAAVALDRTRDELGQGCGRDDEAPRCRSFASHGWPPRRFSMAASTISTRYRVLRLARRSWSRSRRTIGEFSGGAGRIVGVSSLLASPLRGSAAPARAGRYPHPCLTSVAGTDPVRAGLPLAVTGSRCKISFHGDSPRAWHGDGHRYRR
jgi:hypothetical protein